MWIFIYIMTPQEKLTVTKFLKFVNDELQIDKPWKLNLAKERDDDLKTYAYYNKTNGDMKVYTANRGMADVLRSIAHELVHHCQNCKDQLDTPHPDIGGQIEDEANSVAGQLVKKFGYANPELAIYSKHFDVDIE